MNVVDMVSRSASAVGGTADRGDGVFATLLPPGCAVHEIHGDVPDVALFAAEEKIITRALPQRRAEFATARLCARRALVDLGEPAGAVVAGRRGEPRWPAGVVGSVTHCSGFRAAAVARRDDLLAIGIDAEPDLPLPAGVLEHIAPAAGERARLAGLAAEDPATPWDRIMFCVKEAVYKVWSPLTGTWLGFEDAEVRMAAGPDGGPAARIGECTARLRVAGPMVGGARLTYLRGRWARRDGRLYAAIWIATPAG